MKEPFMAKKPTKTTSTSPKIRNLAGKGLKNPTSLTPKQDQELAGSVERHIEPRGKSKKPPKK
jgi:hypothetical protein